MITDASQTCIGRAKKEMGEARMDIEDSEMAYLGYHGSESYGLTWKVGKWIIPMEIRKWRTDETMPIDRCAHS